MSNLDGQMNTFIWVDPTKENQVITAGLLKRVQRVSESADPKHRVTSTFQAVVAACGG